MQKNNITVKAINKNVRSSPRKISLVLESIGLNLINFPLHFYRNTSFYVMRTDSRDRFGTPMEKRYSKKQIRDAEISPQNTMATQKVKINMFIYFFYMFTFFMSSITPT